MRAGAELARALRPVGAALRAPASASRSTPRRGLGRRRPRPAVPRQLVADRDRRDHDRQLRRHATSGPARWAGRCPASRPAIVRRDRRTAGASDDRREPDAEGELALRPGWPSMFRGYLDEDERYRAVLRRRLVPHRRPRPARRRRLLLVRRPRRRRHQVRRPPDRPVRGRERADGAPRRRRGRRDRQARPGRRRGRQGVRRAAARVRAERRAARASSSASRRTRLGAAVAPKEIDFVDALPKTRSGKIMRRLLQGPRARPARGRHCRRWRTARDRRQRPG